MGYLIFIIVAAVILFVYIAHKHNELMKESKELAEKNQYIESGTGKRREWPVGSYFKSTTNLKNFYNSTPMSTLLELKAQGYTFMFEPDVHKTPLAFYKKNETYTAVYSEEEINKLESECIKYIRLVEKQEELKTNDFDSSLRIGNIDEEPYPPQVGERWRNISSDSRLALLDVQCYCVQKAKGTSFYAKAMQALIVIGIDLGFTEKFVEDRVNNHLLEETSISKRLTLVGDNSIMHLVFKSCFWFAVNTDSSDWDYVFNIFMNAGCSMDELSSLL